MLRKLYFSVKMHWRLYLTIIVLSGMCYKLFIWNYQIVNPIVRRDQESYVDLLNSRNTCLTELDLTREEKTSLMLQNNPDL